MKHRNQHIPFFHLLAALALFITAAAHAADDDPNLADFYGFKPLEIFKLEHRSENMLSGDLNGDGKTDLLLVDNSHSRLDLLQQRAKPPEEPEKRSSDVNAVKNDWRFEHRKIPVEKEIGALTIGDFNGDKKIDLAYIGLPDRLIVRYQNENGEWTEVRNFRLPDISLVADPLAAGDINGDGRTDLVLLGKYQTHIALQQEKEGLAVPEGLMNTSGTLSNLRVADLDGDGRNDLSYEGTDSGEPTFCVRLQREDGQLGPEYQFDLQSPRIVKLADIDGKAGVEVLTIDDRTEHIEVHRMTKSEPDADSLTARLVQYGFGREDARENRDLAIGDVDGDGLTDVVVSDPATAQMIVFRQHAGRGLDLGTSYPALIKTEHVRIGNVDENPNLEVIVLSSQEKTIGACRFDGERLTFPTPLPVIGEPVVLELADLNGDGRAEVVYIARQGTGKSAKYALAALQSEGGDNWKPFAFGDQETLTLELAAPPSRLQSLDANKDGKPDLVVFPEFDRGPPTLLVMDDAGVPKPLVSQKGIRLAEVAPSAIFLGRPGRPELLVAQGNFARKLELDESSQWRVVDQYNAAESNAKVVGVAKLNLDGKPGEEVVLVDLGVRRLRVLREEDNVYRPWREVEIGAFSFKSAQVGDLDADGNDDLLLVGNGKFAVLYAGRSDWELKEIANFETKLEKTYFSDLYAGDLNNDGRANIAVIDSQSNNVEILEHTAEKGLRHAVNFRIIEEKSFLEEDGPTGEPREGLIADVTGDGRADLVLLAHDRILLYPQDDGK